MNNLAHLDWPFFTTAQVAEATNLERWAQTELRAQDERELADPDRLEVVCRALASQLGEANWLRAAVPDNFQPCDLRQFCLAREILARHHPLAEYVVALQALGTWPIALFGRPAQQARYLAEARFGRALAAFALSEPEAGSDAAAITTTASRTANGWCLNGVKTWISNGAIADFLVVFARSEASEKARGITAFIVERDDLRSSICEPITVTAPHPLARLTLRDCYIPEDRLLGEPGQGFKIAMTVLDRFRPSVGAAALGLARRALGFALDHTKNRRLFGTTLADLPVSRAQLGTMATELEAATLLVYRAAWQADTSAGRFSTEAAMAKFYATEMAGRVVDAAVQLLGARGVEVSNPVEALYRAVRPLRIYDGASELLRQLIGDQLVSAKT